MGSTAFSKGRDKHRSKVMFSLEGANEINMFTHLVWILIVKMLGIQETHLA